MGTKDQPVSFRVNEDTFEELHEIAEERGMFLSEVLREYVDMLVAHDGRVSVVPDHQIEEAADVDEEFPPTVEVPTSFVREHERLELEAEHLREQLDEYKRYVTALREQLDEADTEEDVIRLEEIDRDLEGGESVDPDLETDDRFTIG